MLSGMAMLPAIQNRLHWLPKLFGNRQGARSVHFLVMIAYPLFLVIHVAIEAAILAASMVLFIAAQKTSWAIKICRPILKSLRWLQVA